MYASPRHDEQTTMPYFNAISIASFMYPNYLNSSCILSILPNIFGQRLFEHAWDYNIVCYKHVYHSWCAITHFFSSSKCLHEGCTEEMHPDWWAISGDKKPSIIEKRISITYQTVKTLVFCDFEGKFIKKFPKLNHSP